MHAYVDPKRRRTSASRMFALSLLLGAVALAPLPARAVPSFARQTGMACQSCHTIFPELTPFGRAFKLNGYQIDKLPQVQDLSLNREQTLLLNQLPPLSFMLQTSFTHTNTALPDSAVAGANSQDGQILLPQQASLFYAGRIAPNLGAFVQMTYSSDSGTIGWDNTEIRFAKQQSTGPGGLTYGFTLNNNPTVQDVWNSTPAWQTPFDQRSSAAPTPGAGAQVDGALAGDNAGFTGYLWWNNSLYAELGFYRASKQGATGTAGAGPLDSAASPVVVGWAPYWRVAYERQWERNSLMVGAYGMTVKKNLAGTAIGGPTDRFRDAALDAQYQMIGDDRIWSLQATYIDEKQSLDASFGAGGSANASDTLKTWRVGGSYYYQRTVGGGLGLFSTTGSADAILYVPASVTGFANSSPNSSGWIGELDYIPWQNVKFALQYISYNKFNGASSNYDGSGRNASDNNTLYALGWFAF